MTRPPVSSKQDTATLGRRSPCPRLVERHASVQLARGPLVEAAAAERVELVAKLVLVPPARDVARDSTPGADLDHVAVGRAQDPSEERPWRKPAGEHEVRPEPIDGRARVESHHVGPGPDPGNGRPSQLAALARAHPRMR